MSASCCASTGPLQVPYRDSVLTKLLATSLQEAAEITMVACLHPLALHIGQSTSTLQFARLALAIKTKPVARIDPQDQVTPCQDAC
jgi:kinesin family member 1